MKKLIKFAIVVAILAFFIIYIVPIIYAKVKGEDNISINDIEFSVEEYHERLKNEPSEIEGMSRYDKLALGLSPYTSDSDMDGLTDDEEMNVYHSDPLKMSTAEDFYTDKYKVDNNMDLNKKYNYEGKISYEGNKCQEITLSAQRIEETFAVVESMDLSNLHTGNMGNITVFKAYKIYNYGGKLDIDVSDIVNDDIKINDISLYIKTLGSDVEKFSYYVDKKKKILTTKDDLDFDNINYIYIVNRGKGVSNRKAKKILADLNYLVNTNAEEATDNVDVKVLVRCRPALGWINAAILHRQSNAKIYFVDSGDPAKNEKALQRMIDALNYMYSYRPNWGPFTVESHAIEAVSEEKYFSLLKGYEVADVSEEHRFAGDVKSQSFYQWLTYCYFTYDDSRSFEFDYSSGHQVRYQTNKKLIEESFDFEEDTLPFENFATEFSPQGTCMGAMVLTTKVFNNGSAPVEDSYDYGGDYGIIKWNLRADENRTFLDRGLNDYKDEKFVKERRDKNILDGKGPLIPRTAGEEEFCKMVGCYWKEGNDVVKKKCGYCERGKSNDYYPGLDPVLAEMDDGKILICGLRDERGAHAVVVYDYQKAADGTITFSVYDNNYPTENGLYLTITPKKATYGNEESFEYEFKTEKYEFISGKSLYFILFMDEDFKVIYTGQPKTAQ